MGIKLKVGQKIVVTAQDSFEKPIAVPLRRGEWIASDPTALEVIVADDTRSASIMALKEGEYSVTAEIDIQTPEGMKQFHAVMTVEVVPGDFRSVEPIEIGLTLDDQSAQLRAIGYRDAEALKDHARLEYEKGRLPRFVYDGAGTHVVTDKTFPPVETRQTIESTACELDKTAKRNAEFVKRQAEAKAETAKQQAVAIRQQAEASKLPADHADSVKRKAAADAEQLRRSNEAKRRA